MALAVVVVTNDDDPPTVQVAAEGPAITVPELPDTTMVETTLPTLPVTLPTVTLPRLTRRPTIPTTTTTARAAAPPPTKPRVASRCETPYGYNDMGAQRTVTSGRLTVTLQVFPCVQYDEDFLQNHVVVEDRGSVIRAIGLDYGDGTRNTNGFHYYQCGDPNEPHPHYWGAGYHVYKAVGTYTVTTTVTTASCDRWAEAHTEREQVTVTVSVDVHRVAGKRPPF